jgi:hypothetical protein
MISDAIQEGFEVFVTDHDKPFGAVRQLRPELLVCVENAGDFTLPLDAVEAVHAQKVIVDPARLSPVLRRAIGHAHDAEDPRI